MHKLYHWRQKHDTIINLTNEYGEKVASIVLDQIRWTNLILGRISREYGHRLSKTTWTTLAEERWAITG
jgi:hypothetical protein